MNLRDQFDFTIYSGFFMNNLKWYIITGAVLGILAAILVYYGNPANMGICAACFLRDTTGALGFHRASMVQYIRPEIIGLIFGGFIASIFWTKDFIPKSSPSASINFILGIFAMIGCLIFLGCPWRAFLRVGGGDMSAIFGILGLASGVWIGQFFKAKNYDNAQSVGVPKIIGLVPIILAFLLFLALVFNLKLSQNGVIFSSAKGPGSQHAPILVSLILSIIVGVLMQKSKFCSIGAFGKLFKGDATMFMGIISIIVFASIANLMLGQYNFGFDNQPIAHTNHIWSFLGMFLAGLCFSLSQGCPGKHLVQMGAGNLGSMIFVFGMMAGAAFSHNFLLASSGKGITVFAPYAVVLGFAFTLFMGVFNKRKTAI